MSGAGRVCGVALREGALGAATVAVHWGIALLAAGLLLAPRPAMPPPKLIADTLELTLAETESDVAREAAALPQAPAAVAPLPEAVPYLSDADSPVALAAPPEALAPPPLPMPQTTAPVEAPPLPDRAPEGANLPEIILPPAQTPPAAQPQPTTGATARLEHPRLTTDLSRLLKRYPPEARRKGWEGTVILKLEVTADGSLAEAALHRSSGYDILDRAALRMIRSARFEGGPGTLLQPIEYRLR